MPGILSPAANDEVKDFVIHSVRASHSVRGNWAQPGRIKKFLCFEEAKDASQGAGQLELLPLSRR